METFSLSLEDPIGEPRHLVHPRDVADIDAGVSHSNVVPEGIVDFDGLDGRSETAQHIENAIQRFRPEFRMRVEHVITVLLASEKRFGPYGSLSPDSPSILAIRMEMIAPFCKHYMLHLDPKNLGLSKWAHALPRPLEAQPEVNDELLQHDAETIEKAILYSARYKTRPTLENIPRDTEQEAMCRRRDGNKCVVTGKHRPRVFWIIPITWNNTVEHNNVTGNLEGASFDLAGIDLVTGPVAACNSRALGETHKAWNMLCIDPTLYDCLIQGLCAFKYVEKIDLQGGECRAVLQFYWMPQMKRRFGKDMDVKNPSPSNPTQRLLREFKDFHEKNFPPPASHKNKVRLGDGSMLESGRHFYVTLPSEDIEKFETVVKLQWACIVFTALCGAAGRPWELCGEKDEDPDENQDEGN